MPALERVGALPLGYYRKGVKKPPRRRVGALGPCPSGITAKGETSPSAARERVGACFPTCTRKGVTSAARERVGALPLGYYRKGDYKPAGSGLGALPLVYYAKGVQNPPPHAFVVLRALIYMCSETAFDYIF